MADTAAELQLESMGPAAAAAAAALVNGTSASLEVHAAEPRDARKPCLYGAMLGVYDSGELWRPGELEGPEPSAAPRLGKSLELSRVCNSDRSHSGTQQATCCRRQLVDLQSCGVYTLSSNRWVRVGQGGLTLMCCRSCHLAPQPVQHFCRDTSWQLAVQHGRFTSAGDNGCDLAVQGYLARMSATFQQQLLASSSSASSRLFVTHRALQAVCAAGQGAP